MTSKEIAIEFLKKKLHNLEWKLSDDSHYMELTGEPIHFLTDAGHFRALDMCEGIELILKELELFELFKKHIKVFESVDLDDKPVKAITMIINQDNEDFEKIWEGLYGNKKN